MGVYMPFGIKYGIFKLDVIDYHAVLGVPVNADTKQIRLRYLKIVPKLHPDTCKAKTEEDKQLANSILSKLVNPAYEVLNKDSSRAEHQIVIKAVPSRLNMKVNLILLPLNQVRY